MKTYIIYTESNYQIDIAANSLKEAIKQGRRACKRDNEVFNSAKLRK